MRGWRKRGFKAKGKDAKRDFKKEKRRYWNFGLNLFFNRGTYDCLLAITGQWGMNGKWWRSISPGLTPPNLRNITLNMLEHIDAIFYITLDT